MDELATAIAAALPAYELDFDATRIERFASYLALVREGNRRTRLVGADDTETLVRRHLCESLYFLRLNPLTEARLVDLGSGAGFPGLALAIAREGFITTMVESNGKKADFLRSAITALGMTERVEVIQAFVERRPRGGPSETDMAATLGSANWFTVRALEKMALVPGWLGNWLDSGAQCALWTTTATAAEWQLSYPQWTWRDFRTLPETRERGIVTLSWIVPRETMAGYRRRRE